MDILSSYFSLPLSHPRGPPTLELPDVCLPPGPLLSMDYTLTAESDFTGICSTYPILSLNLFSQVGRGLSPVPFFFSHRDEETIPLNIPKAKKDSKTVTRGTVAG